MFSQVCVCSPLGALPKSQVLSHVSGPRSFHKGYSRPGREVHQSWAGSTPFPGGGTPVLAGGGVTPVLGGGTPVPAGGIPRLGYPLSRTGLGYPPARTGLLYFPPPRPGLQSEYLLCSGWYASCGQTGLSCSVCVSCLAFEDMHKNVYLSYFDHECYCHRKPYAHTHAHIRLNEFVISIHEQMGK